MSEANASSINFRDLSYSPSNRNFIDILLDDTTYYFFMILLPLLGIGSFAMYGFLPKRDSLSWPYYMWWIVGSIFLFPVIYAAVSYNSVRAELIDFTNKLPLPDEMKKLVQDAALNNLFDQLGVRSYAMIAVFSVLFLVYIVKGYMMYKGKRI